MNCVAGQLLRVPVSLMHVLLQQPPQAAAVADWRETGQHPVPLLKHHCVNY
jgi:hypothetical protein